MEDDLDLYLDDEERDVLSSDSWEADEGVIGEYEMEASTEGPVDVPALASNPSEEIPTNIPAPVLGTPTNAPALALASSSSSAAAAGAVAVPAPPVECIEIEDEDEQLITPKPKQAWHSEDGSGEKLERLRRLKANLTHLQRLGSFWKITTCTNYAASPFSRFEAPGCCLGTACQYRRRPHSIPHRALPSRQLRPMQIPVPQHILRWLQGAFPRLFAVRYNCFAPW